MTYIFLIDSCVVIPFQSRGHQTGQRLQTVHSFSGETCLDKLPGMSGYSLDTRTEKKQKHRKNRNTNPFV